MISAVGAGFYWKTTGNYRPFLQSTLGILVTQESTIYQTSSELGNTTLRNQFPDKYNYEYVAFLQTKLIDAIIVFVLFIYFIFKLFLGVFGWSGQSNFIGRLGVFLKAFLITFLILMTLEVGYYFFMYHEFFYPLKGIITFINNFRHIFSYNTLQGGIT